MSTKPSTPTKPLRLGVQPPRRPSGQSKRAPAPKPINWKGGK